MTQEQLPLLAVLVLENFTLFPYSLSHFRLGALSPVQRKVLEQAASSGEKILVIKSRTGLINAPRQSDLHHLGVTARVDPGIDAREDSFIRVIGEKRAELVELQEHQGELKASIRLLPHIAAKDSIARDAFSPAMAAREEYESACHEAGFRPGGVAFSEPGVDWEDVAILCDLLAQGSQFRLENEQTLKFLDLQPLLEELDPLKRFELFGNLFRAELAKVRSDPDFAHKIEIEQQKRKNKEAQRRQERAENIARLNALAAQRSSSTTISPSPSIEILDLPLLPLRDVVMLPFMEFVFIAGRKSSLQAIQNVGSDNLIFLATQHDAQVDEPKPSDVYHTGIVSQVLENITLPDGNLRLKVLGFRKARVLALTDTEGYYRARLEAPAPIEYPSDLQQSLTEIAELLNTAEISTEAKQLLLETWDGNNLNLWVTMCLPFLAEKADAPPR
jgi:ATP-dependent Lon protease